MSDLDKKIVAVERALDAQRNSFDPDVDTQALKDELLRLNEQKFGGSGHGH